MFVIFSWLYFLPTLCCGFHLTLTTGQYLEGIVHEICQRFSHSGAIHNCYLKRKNGSVTEIDNILVHSSGIYVIECKDYRGWIFGTSGNEYWTEVFRSRNGSRKHQFYNPIRQNEGHIRAVREKLPDISIPIHSIVVFSDYCTFKSITNSSTTHVITASMLAETISRIIGSTQCKLPQPQIDRIVATLRQDSQNDSSIALRHAETVRRTKEMRQTPRSGDTCPLCGSKLVLRNGRYGQFYGCSNYPSCRYTRNIK